MLGPFTAAAVVTGGLLIAVPGGTVDGGDC